MSIFKKKHDLASDVAQYAKDGLDLKTLTDASNELVKNHKKYDLSETPTENNQLSIILWASDREKHEFFTDKETKEGIEKTGITYDGIMALAQKLDRNELFGKKRV
jgi:hypothetical protein